MPHASAASSLGNDLTLIVQEAGFAPGPVWTGAENSPSPVSDPRTVQPVTSRYTYFAILALTFYSYEYILHRIIGLFNALWQHDRTFNAILLVEYVRRTENLRRKVSLQPFSTIFTLKISSR